MTKYLKLNESNCKHCYKCIRYCPVKAISFKDNRAHIIQDECVLCGQCYIICPQNAKSVKNDLDSAKLMINSGLEVYASIAPSFIANYGVSIGSMRKALHRLGFAGADEAAAGAVWVKNKYDEIVNSAGQSVVLSSCCHTVNLMVQRYYPGVLKYLAKTVSPMQAHCIMLKQKNPNAKVVFIGPCISKKAEADEYPGTVDCVITFEELSAWMKEDGITPEPDNLLDSSNESGGRTRLFPITGGILYSMEKSNGSYSYFSIDGPENCLSALDEISKGNIVNCFIEMSACKGGCIGGPCMGKGISTFASLMTISKMTAINDLHVDAAEQDLLKKDFAFQTVFKLRPGKAAIDETLKKMGKTQPDDELNCGSCGYNTCREKAVAILAGKADITMCMPYLMERAQSFSDAIYKNTPDAIFVLNESLDIQQMNPAACHIFNLEHERDVTGRPVSCILDPSPFFDILDSSLNIYDKVILLPEYKRCIILTAIHDPASRAIICIMRDITKEKAEQKRKKEREHKTIELANNVIEKQMRAVQEIASLLGETTADTNVALTRLKEVLRDE